MDPFYIQKEVSLSKISSKYKPIIKDVKNRLLEFSDKIHSIYLYGSIVTGKAKSPTSDMDVLVILKRKPSNEFRKHLESLGKSLSKTYKNYFREIGLAITYKNEILRGEESFGGKFFLTVLCVKVFGRNLLGKEMSFTPTKKLAKNLHSDIKENLIRAKEIILSTKTKDETNLRIKSIMKKIIRTAFSMVMEKENYWTTNLDEMAKIFLKHYPEKNKQITIVLRLARSNSPSKKEAISIIGTFGEWVSSEFFKQV